MQPEAFSAADNSAPQSPPPSAAPPGRFFTLAMIAAALLLGFAAAMKLYGPMAGLSFLHKRGVAEACGELLLAAWLISGLLPGRAWRAAIFAYAIFFGVSVYKAFNHAPSCGCFGPARVPPWVTASVDCLMLMMLMTARPPPRPAGVFGRHVNALGRGMALLAATALGAATAHALIFSGTGLLHPDGKITGNTALIHLDPPTWYGRKFPLQNYVPHDSALRHGNWALLLFRHNCFSCQRAVAWFTRHPIHNRFGRCRRALLEIPRYGPLPKWAAPPHFPWFGINPHDHWYSLAPLILQLHNGRVLLVQLPTTVSRQWLKHPTPFTMSPHESNHHHIGPNAPPPVGK